MKFSKFILISLLLLIFSISAVSAVDDVNSTIDDSTAAVQSTSDVLDTVNVKSDGDEFLKGDSSIVITNETFTDYFDGDGRILDSVPEGATLDFQGQILASDSINAVYINKSIKIISSTNDATITLNSVNGTWGNENIANRFVIDSVSSITISNVIFNRTQMIIYNSSNVILDNVKIISDNYRIIKESSARVAETPLVKFENIDGFCFKNSYVYVYNLGSRLINCLDVKNAVFDNNVFIVHADDIQIDKRVERIISFTTSVPESIVSRENDNSLRIVNTSLNITNNYFKVNYTLFSNSNIWANNILFENNTFEHPDVTSTVYAIGFSLHGFDTSNIIVKNNKFSDISINGKGIVYDNFIKYELSCKGSFLIYNNSMGDDGYGCAVSIYSSSVFYNNDVNGTVRINGENVVIKDSTMNAILFENNARNVTAKNNVIKGGSASLFDGGFARLFDAINVKSTETYIINNTIDGGIKIENNGNCEIYDNIIRGTISINSKLSIIRDNVISAFDSDYAITIIKDKGYINNEISNNKIYSKWYCGDNAVYDEAYLNFIEYNTPKTQIDMFVKSTIDILDYGENTVVVVNVPDVNGNVTIDVDGQKYVVELVGGNASQIISNYSLGINNVTVIYHDDINDVWAINHANFTVNKVAYCPVELMYDNLYEGKHSTVNFILPDDAEGTILVSLINEFCTLNIEQKAHGRNNIISLPGLFEGDYLISASFSSVKYVTNSSGGNISVVHIPVYGLTANAITMDYNDGSKYKVLVTKDGKAVGAGEVVKITFNGVTKNVKTDKKGYASLALDAAPKTYAIKAEYNGVSKSTKVIIKNVLKASNISKKKAKKIKFSATLKNSKGKAIVGKKITFKLKGKAYSAKTNKKGIATITIKNLKVGKYTITSKYGACVVKNIVKIKK